MEVRGQTHAPATLPPAENFRYSLDRRQGVVQSRSGRFGERINLLYMPGFEHGASAVQSITITAPLTAVQSITITAPLTAVQSITITSPPYGWLVDTILSLFGLQKRKAPGL